jgi:Cdc6-like AAA superfamily ATPase
MSESPSIGNAEQAIHIEGSVLEGVQIGGIAGRDLKVTNIQGGVHFTTVNNYIGIASGARRTPVQNRTPEEYKYRKFLRNNVKNSWIKNVLENSLHNRAFIEMGLEKHTNAVSNPVKNYQEIAEAGVQKLPDGTTVESIFNEIGEGRTLLILGEPGAGKTTTLLKLAHSLIKKAEADESQAIPVVFNLFSWGNNPKQDISSWLIQELFNFYKIPTKLGKAWIDKEELILMLDGLDEVHEKHRNDCVKALNNFAQQHGTTELVVSCRIHNYTALTERLRLSSAIYLRPLSPDEINHYIEKAGEQLLALKNVMQSNTELQNFASSPLILSVMSLAYQGCSDKAIIQTGTNKNPYNQLFDTYIERMLQRRQTTQKYPAEKVKYWLIWLAKTMKKDSESIFIIEDINLRYSETTAFVCLVGALINLSISVLICVSLLFLISLSLGSQFGGLIITLIGGLVSGLTGGLIGGMIGGLICWLGGLSLLRFRQFLRLMLWLIGKLFFLPISLLNHRQNLMQAVVLLLFLAIYVLICGLFLGIFSGLICGMIIGGLSSIYLLHLYTRIMLFYKGYIPWKYSHFLDYAAEHLFLQKVGGGYIFVHRMLLEHFALMELDHSNDK